MDTRRLVMLGAVALTLCGCAHLPRPGSRPSAAPPPEPPAVVADAAPSDIAPAPVPQTFATMAPIPDPGPVAAGRSRRARGAEPWRDAPVSAPAGPEAIAAANAAAREPSRARGFLGGVQVFAYDPGRVYEVWTAPLRVTTLTLSRGEAVISKAAGDTVRWQIGETVSGEGAEQRAHVMIKPLVRGLETNLVVATNRRIYLLQLRSGVAAAFNAAITWDLPALVEATPSAAPAAPAAAPTTLVEPTGPLDAAFRIRPKGRRPAWTPSAVATDGMRTFLNFPAGVTTAEAPALFVRGPGGGLQLVNYRQRGRLWVVDQVLHDAELRVGGRRPQVVRIAREGAAP